MGSSLHPITNWPQYNKSLINRGSLTFRIDTEAMNNWFPHDNHGRRGRSQRYTDQTICTFLILKGIFNLTLRATQGLLGSLFELINVPLCAPDYSCVSKRARTVKESYRQPAKRRITDLVIDSTGLKVFGGEWVTVTGYLQCVDKEIKQVLKQWGISIPLNVGTFNGKQCEYLAYHRNEIYRADPSAQ